MHLKTSFLHLKHHILLNKRLKGLAARATVLWLTAQGHEGARAGDGGNVHRSRTPGKVPLPFLSHITAAGLQAEKVLHCPLA